MPTHQLNPIAKAQPKTPETNQGHTGIPSLEQSLARRGNRIFLGSVTARKLCKATHDDDGFSTPDGLPVSLDPRLPKFYCRTWGWNCLKALPAW